MYAYFGIDNPEVLRGLADTYLAQGHVNSEDIIRDPRVVEWVDDYAAQFREPLDPIWEKEIYDPANRWCKEGREERIRIQPIHVGF